jgi:hypothetical protein
VLPWAQRLRIAEHVLEALEYMHARNVCHLDLKLFDLFHQVYLSPSRRQFIVILVNRHANYFKHMQVRLAKFKGGQGSPVAIKESRNGIDICMTFEANLHSRLSHPRIVPILATIPSSCGKAVILL